MENRPRTQPVYFLLSLLCLVVPSLAAQAMPPPPPDDLGPYAVGRQRFQVVDTGRDDRTLDVDVWYPVAPEAAAGDLTAYSLLFLSLNSEVAIDGPPVAPGRHPLVLFSHGNGGISFQSFFLTEVLASHGFIVVSPDHAGNTLVDLLTGSPTQEDILRAALDRPQDISLLIDTMLARNLDSSDPFYRRINRFRIGVTGHSFGGFTSIAMAAGISGEAAEQFGVELPPDFVPVLPDPRVRAIAPIAPASTPFSDGELAGVQIPTLLVGGTADDTTPLDPEITRAFDQLGSSPLYRADILDAGHFSFTNICDIVQVLLDFGFTPEQVDDIVGDATDEGCAEDLIPVEEAQRLTNLHTVAFFLRHLDSDFRHVRILDPRYSEIAEPDVDFFLKRPQHVTLVELLFVLLSILFGPIGG